MTKPRHHEGEAMRLIDALWKFWDKLVRIENKLEEIVLRKRRRNRRR